MNRRANKPARPQCPYKPIPVITERFVSKPPSQGEAKSSLVERFKKFASRLRSWFGWKPKQPKHKQRESKWIPEPKVQAVVDLARRKANTKARNRRNRKATRALHQSQRRAK